MHIRFDNASRAVERISVVVVQVIGVCTFSTPVGGDGGIVAGKIGCSTCEIRCGTIITAVIQVECLDAVTAGRLAQAVISAGKICRKRHIAVVKTVSRSGYVCIEDQRMFLNKSAGMGINKNMSPEQRIRSVDIEFISQSGRRFTFRIGYHYQFSIRPVVIRVI